MLKVMKNRIVDEVEQYLASINFERLRKVKDVSMREYSVFKKQLDNGGALFVTLYIKTGRDHVTPSLQWSRDGAFPADEESQYFVKKDDRESDDNGWLLATYFKSKGSYDLPYDTPSSERIEEITKNKKNAEVMFSHGMDDFPDDDGWWHDWEMIEEFFPDEITEEDVKYAVGTLAIDIISLIRESFLPYFKDLKICKN